MKLIVATGIRLDKLLKDKFKITEYALAQKMGCPCSTIWKIINPDLTRVKTVKLDTVYQIASTLGMSLKEFFNDPIFDEVTD